MVTSTGDIIVGAYESNSYDYPVVRMVTADGEIKIIETKSTEVANKVKKIIEDADATHKVSGSTYLAKTDLTKDMIANLRTMPFGVKSLEKRQADLIARLFPDSEQRGINVTRLVVRAIELHIIDVENLEADE